jgi:hypothetical protein
MIVHYELEGCFSLNLHPDNCGSIQVRSTVSLESYPDIAGLLQFGPKVHLSTFLRPKAEKNLHFS